MCRKDINWCLALLTCNDEQFFGFDRIGSSYTTDFMAFRAWNLHFVFHLICNLCRRACVAVFCEEKDLEHKKIQKGEKEQLIVGKKADLQNADKE